MVFGFADAPSCKTETAIIKDRFFNGGPLDFTNRIGRIDDRMQR